MVIAHYKNTAIAFAPEAISDVINNYTNHYSFVFGYGYGKAPKTKYDLLHQHNRDSFKDVPRRIIQYHSEPFRVDLETDIPKLVIAQYHATLPEYSNCYVVRNPINIYNEVFLPKYFDKKIRIGYAPSTLTPSSKWADKGYPETTAILQALKEKYKDKIDVDIIIKTPLQECLQRKSMCNIFIDESKTGSYHRSALESLAMGQATICSVSPEVAEVMLKASGANKVPFINVFIPQLQNTLEELIEKDITDILQMGFDSRKWMEKYWHPSIIAEEYINIYEQTK